MSAAPVVESINEGQLPGQLRIGGADVRAQITEDFFITQEVKPPKAPEPVAPPAPSLWD